MITLSKTICRILLFTFSFQAIMPAYASFIEADINLTSQLDYQPGIISGHVNSPYIPSQAINLSAPDTIDIDTFYQTLIDGQPLSINASLGVMVGNSAVQTHVIRAQIQRLTGRSILTTVTDATNITEASQIQQLYQDAAHYLNHQLTQGHALKFGDRLNQDPRDFDYEHPIIWPEYRNISGYNNILVPIVYLPKSTYDHFNIASNVVEASGTTTVESLTINDATIRFGQDAYLAVTHDLINNGGTIRGEEGLRITTGGQLQNLSGIISANDDLIIGANSINNSTLLYHYDTAAGTQSTFGEIARIDSDNGNLVIRSAGDIVFEGAIASAPEGELTLASDGNIYLGPLSLYDAEQSRFGNGIETTNTLSLLPSSLSAQDTLTLVASGQIMIDAAHIVSNEGHIEILGQLGISITDQLETTQSVANGTFRKRDVVESVYQTVAIRSILDAGKGIRLHTDLGDITLKAIDITSIEGTSLSAENGAINLLMSVENDHYSYSSVKEGIFTTKTQEYGHRIETGIPNTIIGGMSIEAVQTLQIEVEGQQDLSLDQQITELSQLPGMSWLATVRSQDITPDIDWSIIETQYEEWHQSSTALSPAFAAIISIAVAILTQDYSGNLASALLGGATQGATHAAIQAGFVSLFQQAAVTAGNGLVNGDLVGAMEDMLSSDTLRNLGSAMLTAGTLANLDARFFNYTNVGSSADLSLLQQAQRGVYHAATQASINAFVHEGNFSDGFKSSLLNFAADRIGQNMAHEIGVVFKDENGIGPSLLSFDKAFQYIAHAGAGCIIGAIKSESQGDSDTRQNYCASGALGAVTGEFVGDVYKENTGYNEKILALQGLNDRIKALGEGAMDIASTMNNEQLAAYNRFVSTGDWTHLATLPDDLFLTIADHDYKVNSFEITQNELYELKDQGVDLAKLSAGLAALLTGHDVDVAASAGENAAANNGFFIPLIIKGVGYGLTAFGVYEVTTGFKDKYDRYKDDLTSDDPTISGDAAERLAWELAEDAGIAAGGSLVVTGAAYAGKELFEAATKWDKLKQVIPLLEKAGHYTSTQIDEIKALVYKQKDYKPGDGVDNFPKIYQPTPDMEADLDHQDWLRFDNLVTKGIKTPYGVAKQGADTASISARNQVDNGATLYRIGSTGKSHAAEAQFWSLENPLNEGYAQRYGIPPENVSSVNFIETATVKKDTPFVTRPAPGVDSNTGGGIEVVVPESGVRMRGFHHEGS